LNLEIGQLVEVDEDLLDDTCRLGYITEFTLDDRLALGLLAPFYRRVELLTGDLYYVIATDLTPKVEGWGARDQD